MQLNFTLTKYLPVIKNKSQLKPTFHNTQIQMSYQYSKLCYFSVGQTPINLRTVVTEYLF